MPLIALLPGDGIGPEVIAQARRVLEGLATAKKLANLAKELPGVDVEAETAALMERGLVFHEGERYMSLIVTPPKTVAVPLARTRMDAVAA